MKRGEEEIVGRGILRREDRQKNKDKRRKEIFGTELRYLKVKMYKKKKEKKREMR